MREQIIALAEKHRGLFENKSGGRRTEHILETAPHIDERGLKAVREILSPFPVGDTMLVSLFPTELLEESKKRPDALFDDVDAFYIVEGFYLTDNGLGSYSYGALPSLCPGYIPYAHIKRYVREGTLDCFAYARGLEPDGEGRPEAVETLITGLEYFSFFFTKYKALFHDLFALLQSQGRLLDCETA